MARRNTSNGTLKIEDRILGILAGFHCTGNVAHRHAETLDPKDYKALNEILEALGGRWQKSSKALPGGGHLFPESTDAAALLEAAMMTGSVKDPKVGDFFETPVPLARRMVEIAGVGRGASVLEPSAGHGRIALAARGAGADVFVVEQDDDRFAKLNSAGFARAFPPPTTRPDRWVGQDFLGTLPKPTYDAVLMNPPFSREQDIAHVTHALRFVKPGGKVVAITGPGWRFRQTKAAEAFRKLMDDRGADVEELPEGTFKESGTDVRSLLLTIAA